MADYFNNLIGQSQAVGLLTQAVERDRLAPAYLFTGSAGVGRSLAVKGFIELIFSRRRKKQTADPKLHQRIRERNHPDLLWVEPTYLHQGKRFSEREMIEAGLKRKARPQIRLDQIREVSQFLSRSALETHRLIVVLEGAETMAEAAANGLLKTLEEPEQASLILMATSADTLLPTLVSRCATIPFRRLGQADLATVLHQVDAAEILNHPEILAMAQGSPGQAINHWQQLQALEPEFLKQLEQLPQTLREALTLAKQVSQTLDPDAQLWLTEYLQQKYWQQYFQRYSQLATGRDPVTPINPQFLRTLEISREQLRKYVQPRLVWECTFLSLCQPSRA
ncbi:MAG: DNA polymerase III subunit delta' [Microcoleaceae cyanobacterium]